MVSFALGLLFRNNPLEENIETILKRIYIHKETTTDISKQ